MKHEKAKANLCKLPISDMSKNAFSTKSRSNFRNTGLRDFVHNEKIHRNEYSSLNSRNGSRSRSRKYLIGSEPFKLKKIRKLNMMIMS